MVYDMSYKKTTILANALFFEEVKAMLQKGKSVKIPVKGSSMLPFLKEGDVVMLKAISPFMLRKGNIILGYHERGYVLHRLVNKHEGQFILAGDGNLCQIEKIQEQDVLAVVLLRLQKDDEQRMDTFWQRCLGMCWYRLRTVRKWGVRFKRVIKL